MSQQVTASRKVLQTLPNRLCSATEWEAEHDGSLHQVRLKTRYGHFLRPSGGIPPWRNIVTHDVPRRRKANLWEIEIMETHKALKKKCHLHLQISSNLPNHSLVLLLGPYKFWEFFISLITRKSTQVFGTNMYMYD